MLVFISDPISSMTPGFSLSFGAVVALLWFARSYSRPVRGWRCRQLVAMQLVLLFGLMPLTVLIFQRIAFTAPVVNLLAVPVFSAVTVPLTLASMIVNPVWVVLLVYACVTFSIGVIIATVFQLAHCVEDAEFPAEPEPEQLMPTDWATHQLRTSVEFARSNRFLSWYLGGLNFQAVHHLFPKTCHIH